MNEEEIDAQQEQAQPEAEDTTPNLAEAYANAMQQNQEVVGLGMDLGGNEPGYEEQPTADGYQQGYGADNSGYADELPEFDVANYKQQLIEGITKMSQDNALQELSEKVFNGGRPRQYTAQDLYVRNEDGSCYYRNPDNERRPFESRAEAQAYVDSINISMKEDLRNRQYEFQQQAMKACEPTFEMIDFIPTYSKLDKTTQDVLEDIIAPYELRADNGETLGYSCDLNSALRQAQQIVSRFSNKTQTPLQQAAAAQQPAPVEQPAVDMPSSSSSSQPVKNTGPSKSFEEAMQRRAQERWENKYGKQN